MLIKGVELRIGNEISLATTNRYDANRYAGKFCGYTDFNQARLIWDVQSYHRNVAIDRPNIPDVTQLNYVILMDDQGVSRAFAEDWIPDGEIRLLSGGYEDFRITGITPNLEQAVVAAITALGLTIRKLPKV